ncbi:succinate dehydrogenase cytochrome b subunit [Echinicola sp. CAU 1574]|uniref:Succinate dehydrogenase cytochrome b subunit n=1 Tax=Echinicola arenosa TaxID=2774144 RepID=A0ABR9AFM0_9BACT|nr:succinate dehydrogenase cytochrome b subunit [Echinicola arenosa]MBD8487239.1 succinate dehydrogenase cytochrome b subunit [Echinicola arenosa]
MSWVTKTFSSTLGRKLLMALTGLFLILFLIGHVSGNMLLFKDDGGQAFNEYAKFMTTNPAVKILSYLTYISIIGHVIFAIMLSVRNKKARPVNYAEAKSGTNSSWNSRNMGILGTIVLIFIVVHLQNFWAQMHWGAIPTVTYESGEYKDLYAVVNLAFSNIGLVALYVVAMAFLAFHLNHGFASAFQTLGLNHKKYTPAIQFIGSAFSIIVPAMFASMPIFIYFSSLN